MGVADMDLADRPGAAVMAIAETDVASRMSADTLRQKRHDGTPVFWPRFKAYGIVTRVASDGAWADMVWWQGPPNLNRPPDGCAQWRKRQPLKQINEWEHG
jgi:hypothetical protein